MSFYKNLHLSAQLLSAFFVVALISGVVGAVGYTGLVQVDKADTFLYEKCTVPLAQMGIVHKNFQLIRIAVYRAILQTDREESKKIWDGIGDLEKVIKTQFEGYERTFIDAQDEAEYKKMVLHGFPCQ